MQCTWIDTTGFIDYFVAGFMEVAIDHDIDQRVVNEAMKLGTVMPMKESDALSILGDRAGGVLNIDVQLKGVPIQPCDGVAITKNHRHIVPSKFIQNFICFDIPEMDHFFTTPTTQQLHCFPCAQPLAMRI
jgi:hypothetical protein